MQTPIHLVVLDLSVIALLCLALVHFISEAEVESSAVDRMAPRIDNRPSKSCPTDTRKALRIAASIRHEVSDYLQHFGGSGDVHLQLGVKELVFAPKKGVPVIVVDHNEGARKLMAKAGHPSTREGPLMLLVRLGECDIPGDTVRFEHILEALGGWKPATILLEAGVADSTFLEEGGYKIAQAAHVLISGTSRDVVNVQPYLEGHGFSYHGSNIFTKSGVAKTRAKLFNLSPPKAKPTTPPPTPAPTSAPTPLPTPMPTPPPPTAPSRTRPRYRARPSYCDAEPMMQPQRAQASPDDYVTFHDFGNWGRLGNQLFQYAALKGLAAYHGFQARLPNGYQNREIHAQTCLMGYFHPKIPEWQSGESGCCANEYDEHESVRFGLDQNLLSMSPSTNLKGYFFSWRYHCNVWDELQHEFQLKDNIRLPTIAKLGQIKDHFVAAGTASATSPIVGVHVRRGDIKEQDDWFRVPSQSYLHAAMDWFIAKYKDPVFVVCSGGAHHHDTSDIDWCKDNIQRPNTYFANDNQAIMDFALLALSDHAVFTSGTFGWWAAHLTGGDVVGWKRWQKQDFYFGHEHEWFPPDWHLLDID